MEERGAGRTSNICPENMRTSLLAFEGLRIEREGLLLHTSDPKVEHLVLTHPGIFLFPSTSTLHRPSPSHRPPLSIYQETIPVVADPLASVVSDGSEECIVRGMGKMSLGDERREDDPVPHPPALPAEGSGSSRQPSGTAATRPVSEATTKPEATTTTTSTATVDDSAREATEILDLLKDLTESLGEYMSSECVRAEALAFWREREYQAACGALLHQLCKKRGARVGVEVPFTFLGREGARNTTTCIRADIVIESDRWKSAVVVELKYVPITYSRDPTFSMKDAETSYDAILQYNASLNRTHSVTLPWSLGYTGPADDTRLMFELCPQLDDKYEKAQQRYADWDPNVIFACRAKNGADVDVVKRGGHLLGEIAKDAMRQVNRYADLIGGYPRKPAKSYVLIGYWRSSVLFGCTENDIAQRFPQALHRSSH